MESLISSSFNLTLLIAILFFKLRGPVKDFVAHRQSSIRHDIQVVGDQLKKAKQDFTQFSNQLARVDQEVKALFEENQREILKIQAKIQADTTYLVEKVMMDTQSRVSSIQAEFKGQLSAELGARVMDRAEFFLMERLTQEDRTRLQKEFFKQMESTS